MSACLRLRFSTSPFRRMYSCSLPGGLLPAACCPLSLVCRLMSNFVSSTFSSPSARRHSTGSDGVVSTAAVSLSTMRISAPFRRTRFTSMCFCLRSQTAGMSIFSRRNWPSTCVSLIKSLVLSLASRSSKPLRSTCPLNRGSSLMSSSSSRAATTVSPLSTALILSTSKSSHGESLTLSILTSMPVSLLR